MNIELEPFKDDKVMIITDKHGNELNIENNLGEMAIYGQWQGFKESEEFKLFFELLKKVKEVIDLEVKSKLKECAGISIVKKKDELLLDVNLTLKEDNISGGQILKFMNKVKKLNNN